MNNTMTTNGKKMNWFTGPCRWWLSFSSLLSEYLIFYVATRVIELTIVGPSRTLPGRPKSRLPSKQNVQDAGTHNKQWQETMMTPTTCKENTPATSGWKTRSSVLCTKQPSAKESPLSQFNLWSSSAASLVFLQSSNPSQGDDRSRFDGTRDGPLLIFGMKTSQSR